MGTAPLVSVIIPAYNAAPFLTAAVESVERQTLQDLELIVVDDGSTDGTPQLADELAKKDGRCRVVHKPNGGPSAARNAGLAIARGEFVAFLDADDIFLPDKLERQRAFLDLFPACDLVYSDHYIGDGALNPIWLECRTPPEVPIQDLFSFCCWFAPMAPLLRARLVARVGRFDEDLISSEDWDYWLRASRCGVFAYLPGPVGVYRTHPGQAHHNQARLRVTQEKVIRKHFQPGSEPWRMAYAALAWTAAKQAKAEGSYARMATNLLGLAWYARSRRRLRTVTRFGH